VVCASAGIRGNICAGADLVGALVDVLEGACALAQCSPQPVVVVRCHRRGEHGRHFGDYLSVRGREAQIQRVVRLPD